MGCLLDNADAGDPQYLVLRSGGWKGLSMIVSVDILAQGNACVPTLDIRRKGHALAATKMLGHTIPTISIS